jgi:hypothetical protein
MIKYSKSFLDKIEDLLIVAGYVLRYEKGNFKAGYCLLKSTKVIIINKYFTLEGRINCLVEIIKKVEINRNLLDEKQVDFLDKI